MTKYLQIDQVIDLHNTCIKRYGGVQGVRDENLLHSAIHAPMATVFGQEMYPCIYDKAAVYLYHIIKNHPFYDGNKRTGYSCAITFLISNKIKLTFPLNELKFICVQVAKGELSKSSVGSFFRNGG